MPDRGRRLLSGSTRHRLIAWGSAALAGLVIYAVVPGWLRGPLRFVAAYDAGTLTLLAIMWHAAIHADPARTRARAVDDDPGRNLVLLIVFATVATGLVAAIEILGHGPKTYTFSERWESYGLAAIAVGGGWVLMHTAYTFRYAHLYYHEGHGACGGIRFPGTPHPSDIDFAYFAFAIGTSFAVSDPEVTDTAIRREVIGHSIISFAYNSAIIGMMINIFAGIFAAG